MATVYRKRSDFSGEEIPEDQEIEVVVRNHPASESPFRLDATENDLKALKTVGDVVQLDFRIGETGPVRTLLVPLAEFRKAVSDDVVKEAPSSRGRRPGERR